MIRILICTCWLLSPPYIKLQRLRYVDMTPPLFPPLSWNSKTLPCVSVKPVGGVCLVCGCRCVANLQMWDFSVSACRVLIVFTPIWKKYIFNHNTYRNHFTFDVLCVCHIYFFDEKLATFSHAVFPTGSFIVSHIVMINTKGFNDDPVEGNEKYILIHFLYI